MLIGEQACTAKEIILKAKEVANQSQQFKRKINFLEDDLSELSAHNKVLEEKLATSMRVCNEIADKYREAVSLYSSEMPVLEKEID